jgi:alpha-glucosidase (family GH31 glycosyl hydrolase)
MHQHEYVPSSYSLLDGAKENNDHASLILQSKGTNSSPPATFTFEAFRPNLFRTTFTSPQHPLPPHPSVIKPERSFGNVVPTSKLSAEQKVLNMGRVTASINWEGAPLVSLSINGQQVHQDLHYRSYALDGQGIAHYTHYRRNTLHVGLGDKAAPMDLSNRFFHIAATDCFGYDVYRTDPMYKHIPLLINVMPTGCVAIFSTSHSRATWPVGSEIEGLWGHFKVLRQEYGGLEEYLIVGRNI